MTKKLFSKKNSKLLSMDIIRESLNKANGRNNKLIIYTAAGIFTGKIQKSSNIEDTKILEQDTPITCYRKLYTSNVNEYFDKYSKEFDEVAENPITITLEDAEFNGPLANINLPFVEIFLDQIIAFTVGSVE